MPRATVAAFALTTVAKLVLGVRWRYSSLGPSAGAPAVFLAVFLPWAYPGGRQRRRLVLDAQPAAHHLVQPRREPLKHAVDGALGTGAWAFASVLMFNMWRGRRRSPRSSCSPDSTRSPTELLEYARLESRSGVAALLARHAAPAPPLHRPRRLPVVHHGLRRPRQRLDAHGRAHRVPAGRHPGVLARDQARGEFGEARGVVPLAGPPARRRAVRPLPVVRPGRGPAPA